MLAEGQRNVTVIGTVNSFSFPSASVKVDVISTSGIISAECILKAIESLDKNSLSTNEFILALLVSPSIEII